MIMRPVLTSSLLLLASVAAGCGPVPSVDVDAGRRDGGMMEDGAVADAETPPGCGDGRRLTPETCDDGNLVAGDGCSPMCMVERGWACDGSPVRCHSNCGDGIVAGDEECDDRNTRPNDGCNTACGEEPGYSCAGEPSVCEMGCGDGTISDTEDCDDGNAAPDDGCSISCRVEAGWTCMGMPSTCAADRCGDGLVRGTEACDDGSTVPGDGCSATCTVEPGFACDGEPSVCVSGCGDGVVGASETCDDGGLTAGDGCSGTCRVESGWSCVGAPSECTPVCGDGIVTGGEGCDDDNLTADDGCGATCLVERGFACVGTMPSVCGATCGDAIVASSEGCDDGDADAGDGCGASCEVEFAFGCTGEPSVCLQIDRPVAVALGETSGCVRTFEGRARCWGGNLRGEVGDGTQITRFMPVTAAVDQVVDFDVGAEFACAVRMNGEVWCWGDHRSKQQGLGIPAGITAVPSPGPLPGLASMVAVSTGDDHACALDDVGAVWCWGANGRFQLGRGGTGTTNDPTPTAVTISGAATQVACGGRHTCVVLAGSGAVECWGDDTGAGQLGDGGSNTSQSLPVGVIGLSGIAQVAAGDRHTCARSSAGDVWCWGDNADGQLGNGATADAPTPVTVTLPGAATWITAGAAHTCALIGGAAYCWGRNAAGQLGDGTRLPSRTPIAASALPSGVTLTQLDAGALGTCGIGSDDQRYCWGQGDDAQLGIVPATQLAPVATSLTGTIARISGTRPREHATYCASRTDGTVACWGSSETNLLSDPSGADATTPREIAALSGVLELGMGADFACARTAMEVQCWGEGSQLQLGQGSSTTDLWSPTAVMSLPGASVVELAVGELFACARMTTGEVRCWGDSAGRQVGLNQTSDSGIPTAIPDVSGATSIAAGEDHACAVLTGGEVRCWGEDGQGQLGDGSPSGQRPYGLPVMMLPAATQVALGRDHSCALLASGAVHCWGENGFGQIGDGGTTDRSAPRVVGSTLSNVVQIAAGWDHTCARRSDGTVACWGAGAHGQLGSAFTPSGTTTWATSPVELVGVSGALDISATATSTCVRDAGGVRCVGFHSFGQLGQGLTLRPLTALAAPL